MFTSNPTYRSGWYSGHIVKAQRGVVVPYPVNWKATSNGIIIDHVTSTETIHVLKLNSAAEIMSVTHSNAGGAW